jgi:5-formyltetrahydrofolate cyclo-ligase
MATPARRPATALPERGGGRGDSDATASDTATGVRPAPRLTGSGWWSLDADPPAPTGGRGTRSASPGRPPPAAAPPEDADDPADAGGSGRQVQGRGPGEGGPTAGDAAVAAAKSALRRRLLATRRARPPAPGDDAARTRLLLAMPELVGASCVAAYVALPGEPATAGLLSALRGRGTVVLLPAVLPDRDLVFLRFGGTLAAGPSGTLAPPPGEPPVPLSEADAIVVPALAVDQAGRRLGRGGGSYDRALVRARSGVPLVALVHDDELLAEVPAADHDRLVTVAVTARRVIRLGAQPRQLIPPSPE